MMYGNTSMMEFEWHWRYCIYQHCFGVYYNDVKTFPVPFFLYLKHFPVPHRNSIYYLATMFVGDIFGIDHK
jgi:hypothetical protein